MLWSGSQVRESKLRRQPFSYPASRGSSGLVPDLGSVSCRRTFRPRTKSSGRRPRHRPRSGLHSFNDVPVLLQPAQARVATPPVIQAGRAGKAAPTASSDSTDQLQLQDPWAAYLRSKPGKEVQPGPPREAPTARRFDAQDGRIVALEQQLQVLQGDQQALRQEVAGTRTEVTAQLQEAVSFQASFTQQLQDNLASFRQAQEAQQTQVNQGFAELKALLQASSTVRPSKRHAPDSSQGLPHMELDAGS